MQFRYRTPNTELIFMHESKVSSVLVSGRKSFSLSLLDKKKKIKALALTAFLRENIELCTYHLFCTSHFLSIFFMDKTLKNTPLSIGVYSFAVMATFKTNSCASHHHIDHY